MRTIFTDEIAKKLTQEAMYEYHGSAYENHRRYIDVTCNNGHRYKTRWDQFKTGCRCKECQRLTYDNVKAVIETEGYILKSKEYKAYHENLDLVCPCGHEISMQYANFVQGKRCKICANNVRHDIEYVKNLVEKESGYKLLSDTYKNWESKLTIQCNKGHVFTASYNSFEQGHRCPYCSRSVGEEKIASILDGNVEYFEQYKFNDCENIRSLPFDFYIPSKNTVIEYQGRQHYESIDFFGGEKAFEQQKYRDDIKAKYCLDNGINLLAIPYTNYNNIEQILHNNKII